MKEDPKSFLPVMFLSLVRKTQFWFYCEVTNPY